MSYPKPKSMPSRDVNQLCPAARAKCLEGLKKCRDAGYILGISQTWRSGDYQHQLFTQRPKVTNCDRGESPHEFRIAWDVYVNMKGKNIYDTAILDKCGQIFESIGCIYGGDWNNNGLHDKGEFVDRPHIQYNGGYTDRQIRAGKVPSIVTPKPVPKPSERSTTTYIVIGDCKCYDKPNKLSKVVKTYNVGDKLKVYSVKSGFAELDYDWYVESKYLKKV
jgi:hypothetical protein